jgi:hypothetical protein
MSKFKYPLLALASVACAALAGMAYEGYDRSVKLYKAVSSPQLSKFELAANKLGFSSPVQQEALLTIFYLAGYFKSEKLWQDLVNFNKRDNPVDIFSSMEKVMIKAGANQDDPSKFNAGLLRKGLFANVEIYDSQDIEDWLLYVAQNAFNRKIGEERYELTNKDWMVKHQALYIEQAQKLGLIDEIVPNYEKYDKVWIAGASRIGLLARIIYYDQLIAKQADLVQGNVLVLAGQRPLWAEIDGINPETYQKLFQAWQGDSDINNLKVFLPIGEDLGRIEEGKKYIQALAESYGIKLNPDKPFIEYTKETAPQGYFAERTYPNYASLEQKKLTESLMAADLGQKFLKGKAKLIDTQSGAGGIRPDTAATARDAAESLIQKILKEKLPPELDQQKKFTILLVSNNPYIERQTIATQREVDKLLVTSKLDQQGYSIKIDGVGFRSTQDVATIHSELAALSAEKYKNSHPAEPVIDSFRHQINELLSQTRNYKEVGEFPGTSSLESLIGSFEDVFDHWH